MTTNYPANFDTTGASGSLPTESATTPLATQHVAAHQNLSDAAVALETKLGVDSSADTTSIDYKLKSTSSINPGHKHTVTSVSLAVEDLTNVKITSVADADALSWNATDSKWENRPASVADASTTTKGVTKMDVAPTSSVSPIAVGSNNTHSGTATGSGNKVIDEGSTSTTASANKLPFLNSSGFIPMGMVADYQLFTSSGTWTKPAGLTGNELVIVQIWGGGGAGGGTANGTAGGGGGGGYSEGKFRASDLASTITVTVGAGGTGGTGNGPAGNNTTFGTKMTAYAGGGGAAASAGGAGGGGGGAGCNAVGSNSTSTTGGNGGGIIGGTTTIADSNFGGGFGGTQSGTGAGNTVYGGGGGSAPSGGVGGTTIFGGGGGAAANGSTAGTSVFGGAGGTAATDSSGGNGVAPGGGGGGAVSTGTTHSGGSGGRGEVRVWTLPI